MVVDMVVRHIVVVEQALVIEVEKRLVRTDILMEMEKEGTHTDLNKGMNLNKGMTYMILHM